MLKRWKITIEYNGTNFIGWQKQAEGDSVQSFIEAAIKAFCGQEIPIHVAGRTDAGVHAHGQVAHFDLDYGDRTLTGFELVKAINAHLRPQPIAVIHAEEVAQDFHARFSAKNKLYIYRMIVRPGFLALDQDMAWHFKRPLDVQAMIDAAQVLVGHHDFTTFRDSQCQAKSPMRTLDRLDIQKHEYDAFGGVEVQFHLEAQSFLHHQVRNIVGTLTLVGEGKWTKQDLQDALKAKDRTRGGPTAPADGLCLVRIEY